MDTKGQSILEVIFVLPILFLFVGLLFKINMSIQMAINNTQHARSQIYILTGNSSDYPRLRFRYFQDMFFSKQQDLMVLGVADPTAVTGAAADEDTMEPRPQEQHVTRNTSITGSGAPGEVNSRSHIRVRDTSAICTQLNMALNANGKDFTSPRWPFGRRPVCGYSGAWIGDL